MMKEIHKLLKARPSPISENNGIIGRTQMGDMNKRNRNFFVMAPFHASFYRESQSDSISLYSIHIPIPFI